MNTHTHTHTHTHTQHTHTHKHTHTHLSRPQAAADNAIFHAGITHLERYMVYASKWLIQENRNQEQDTQQTNVSVLSIEECSKAIPQCFQFPVSAQYGIIALEKAHRCSPLPPPPPPYPLFLHLSTVPLTLPMKQYQCWSNWTQIMEGGVLATYFSTPLSFKCVVNAVMFWSKFRKCIKPFSTSVLPMFCWLVA